MTTLAFDIYGTLIDTHGVSVELHKLVGDRAAAFSQSWRDKQLEYSFRRGLMHSYQDFAQCTKEALEYCDKVYATGLCQQDKQQLMNAYKVLPAFADVKAGLDKLKYAGFSMYAFSNGSRSAVEGLLGNAGIESYFTDIVSVDEIKTFKPDPEVYHHFLKRSGTNAVDCWLVSSNSFDVTGAISAGWKAAWVKRTPAAVFDPWELSPTVVVSKLTELTVELQGQ